ncbi:MAG: substrate-binding domain-containing protein [Planctomycetota bacterium]
MPRRSTSISNLASRLAPRALLVAATAFVLTACGGGSSEPSPRDTGEVVERSYVFAVIAKNQSNPVFQAARNGAIRTAAKLEQANPGVTVEINWRTPTDESAERQAQYIDQLVSQGVDGIAVSCSDAEILTGAINAAVERGVPVVTFDSDAPDSQRFAYAGIDDVEAGRTIMRTLADALGGEGTVAILGGNQTAPNLQARIRGVREEATNHDGITMPDNLVFYHAESAPEAVQALQSAQQNNPEITGWAMVGGWPLFTKNALDGVHENTTIVSVDHLRDQLAYVREGQVHALIGQDCFRWGAESVRLLFDKVHKGEEPENARVTFDVEIVTQNNVEEFEGVWESWLSEG